MARRLLPVDHEVLVVGQGELEEEVVTGAPSGVIRVVDRMARGVEPYEPGHLVGRGQHWPHAFPDGCRPPEVESVRQDQSLWLSTRDGPTASVEALPEVVLGG